jgi:hypothetical protein
MAFGSQKTNVAALSGLTGLVHEIYTGDVLPSVRWESITAQLFMNASEGDYRYDGESLNGATDLVRPVGALGTGGALPDSSDVNPGEWQTTPVRRYVRRAVDNFVEAAAIKGPGAFADLGTRLFDQMWGAFRLMEIRHAVGGSAGTLCLVSSRTSATVWVAKDGYGHTDMSPTLHLDEKMVIAWLDITNSNTATGSDVISSIVHSTDTITMSSGTLWDPGTDMAAGDIIVAATTDGVTVDYYDSERNNAKNGLLDIVDPNADNTTVLNLSQTTFPRWKPYRVASATFDHIEVTEFFRKQAAKSTFPVGPESHTAVCHGAIFAELARTLVGFQQQQQLGKTLEGGYQSIRISGFDFAIDDYQLHNVLYNICNEDLYTVSLVEAGYFDEDGSMYERISDFDGKEWYVRDYTNSFSPRRVRHGALTAITLANVTAGDFDPVPDW